MWTNLRTWEGVSWCTQRFCWDTQHVGWNYKNALHPNNINKAIVLSSLLFPPILVHASFFFLFLRLSSSCSCFYGHRWPIHLLLPLPTAFFFRFLFVFLFLWCFFFLSPSVFMVVPCNSSSSASRTAMILLLCVQQKKMTFFWKNPIRIINPYGSYGLAIRIRIADLYEFFLLNNFFPICLLLNLFV